MTATIPLLIERQRGEAPVPDCRHSLVLPIGDAVHGLIDKDVDDLLDQMLAGNGPKVRLPPIRVMPASEDVVRLWGHERALQQLLHEPWFGLQCECPAGCRGEGCVCVLALKPIHDRVRVGYMHPDEPACLA